MGTVDWLGIINKQNQLAKSVTRLNISKDNKPPPKNEETETNSASNHKDDADGFISSAENSSSNHAVGHITAESSPSNHKDDAVGPITAESSLSNHKDDAVGPITAESSLSYHKDDAVGPITAESSPSNHKDDAVGPITAESSLSYHKDDAVGPITAESSPSNHKDNADERISSAERSMFWEIIEKDLIESTQDLKAKRQDPTSPLYSIKTFEAFNLKEELLRGVYSMGFNAPSKIQDTALPILLANPAQNMIAQSQSGTGKTAAFVLTFLTRVDVNKEYTQVLCLSPTYELAIQTDEVAAKISQFCSGIKIRCAVRGVELPRGTKLTDHIIIGTPGKVLDWSIKYRFFDLSKITVFVLDEADIMIATQGHQDQCIRIHKHLSKSSCQMLFFSATYEQEVMKFAEIIVSDPMILRLAREEESLNNIKQYYVSCKNADEKYEAITNIYGVISIGQAIIFCQTRKTASWLAEKMTKDGHTVGILSGDLSIEQRIAILNRFRAGLEKVLIATNVLARGIDVAQVTIVVNFDLPIDLNGYADCETYLHRIGRTGRFGKSGLAINLIDSPETMQLCNKITNHFGREIKPLDATDLDELEKIGN